MKIATRILGVFLVLALLLGALGVAGFAADGGYAQGYLDGCYDAFNGDKYDSYEEYGARYEEGYEKGWASVMSGQSDDDGIDPNDPLYFLKTIMWPVWDFIKNIIDFFFTLFNVTISFGNGGRGGY